MRADVKQRFEELEKSHAELEREVQEIREELREREEYVESEESPDARGFWGTMRGGLSG